MNRTNLWTRDELLSLLADWKLAYKAASSGSSYTIAGRSLKRQDIPEIRSQLDYLQGELDALSNRKSGLAILPARVVRGGRS